MAVEANLQLGAGFLARNASTGDLLGIFVVRHSASQELLGKFTSLYPNEELHGEFVSRHAATRELKAGFDGQVSLNLKAGFTARHPSSQILLGEFNVTRSRSVSAYLPVGVYRDLTKIS